MSQRFTPFHFWLLLLAYACGSTALAQPVIDDAEIAKASRPLRRLLYRRLELRQEISNLESELEQLKRREKRLSQLVELRKEFDDLERRIAAANDDKNRPLARRLEQQAEMVEQKIEHRETLGDLEDSIDEFRRVRRHLLRREQEKLVPPVDRLLDNLASAQRLAIERHERLLAGEEDRVEVIDEEFEELEYEIGEGEEYVGLLEEMGEAYEDEDEDRALEILEELEEFLDNRTESVDEKEVRIDPSMKPVEVTADALAGVANRTFAETAIPLLRRHCFECHSNDSQSGELNLETLASQRPLVLNRQKWINVLEQTKNRVMPPPDANQPDDADRTQLVLVLHNAIHNFDYSSIRNPGFEPTRRLTHDEYDNTIRDLFGMDIRPTERFPQDLVGSSGFDNSANTLFLQPLLMERYMNAADLVVETALPDSAASEEHMHVRRKLFVGDGVDDSRAPQFIQRFLLRAWRRIPSDAEVSRAVGHYKSSRESGKSKVAAARDVFRLAISSPNFLLRSEQGRDTAEPFRISDWELASRLSYFLWSSMPDHELFELADKGKLSQPDVLTAQVDRMIDNPRSKTLGSLFAAQWLGSRHLGTRMRMDPIDNPWCTESLMKAMRDETAVFVHSLFVADAPISELVGADYTFLNEELARHYGIRGVSGDAMQRINLEDSERGGIFGHGSLLAVTSFPGRTSPVVRGRWILADVLGTPPPPPPPNVSELPEKIERNRKLTFRQKLEVHRSAPNCYACHSQMDPLGFSLEGYDFFGRKRKSRRGRRIDIRGELPNGTTFEGLSGLKKVILEQRLDDLTKQAAAKMLSYALGRQLQYYDEPALRSIVTALGENEGRLRTLVLSIVRSFPFQFKQTTAADSP